MQKIEASEVMSRAELAALVEKLVPQTEKIFRKHGKYAPTANIYFPDGYDRVRLYVNHPSERRAVFEHAAEAGARAIVFIAEAWMASEPPGTGAVLDEWKRSGRSLEQWPGRQEIAFLIAACPDGEILRTWRIKRGGGRPHLVPFPEEHQDPYGIMHDLPWRKES